MLSTPAPFALSPSASLRTCLSKPVVSLSNQVNEEYFSILLKGTLVGIGNFLTGDDFQ